MYQVWINDFKIFVRKDVNMNSIESNSDVDFRTNVISKYRYKFYKLCKKFSYKKNQVGILFRA